MAGAFQHEDVARVPRGFKVRTVSTRRGHRVRLAFPQGRRRKGSGRVVSVLQPRLEKHNPSEEIKDDRGRQWQVDWSWSSGEQLWGIKATRKGHQVRAKGRDESEAWDNLLEKIMPSRGKNPPKRKRENPLGLRQAWGQASTVMREQLLKSIDGPTALSGRAFEKLPVGVQKRLVRIVMKDGTRSHQKVNPPGRRALKAPKGHKPGCGCFACARQSTRRKNSLKCPRCHRPVSPWPLARADRCSPKGYKMCIRSAAAVGADIEKRKSAKSNPNGGSAAAELYQRFHGKPHQEVIEVQKEIVRRKNYAGLGNLVELYLPDVNGRPGEPAIRFTRNQPLLASNATDGTVGTQLYVIGGDQDLEPLAKMATWIDWSKDFIDLGPVAKVVYRARKGFDGFELTDYEHRMGEGGKEKPRLMYDKLNRQLYFTGGAYQVKAPGIVN